MDHRSGIDESLKWFLNKYGTSTTTNFDLRDILRDLKLQCKVIMRDEIIKYLNSENIIFNLQTIKEKGSHWVFVSKEFKIYFDSYGILPVKEIYEYIKDDFKYNTLQVQPENSEMCGQLCIYVLYQLENKMSFEDIILELNENFSL